MVLFTKINEQQGYRQHFHKHMRILEQAQDDSIQKYISYPYILLQPPQVLDLGG